MMKTKPSTLFMILAIAMFLISCKPGVPSKYIQPGEMENILYDYHVADGMASQMTVDRGFNQYVYRYAVLNKYGVTEAEFDSSMVYYIRHTDQLHGIYESLTKRLSNEAEALGSSANGADKYSSLSATGDTVDIWNGNRSMLLIPQLPFNQSSYTLKTDSGFHKGDNILLNFDAQFIYQDGMRDGIAEIVVHFGNDSIASQVLHISSSSTYALQINDDKHKGIKEIKGFFMLGKGNANASITTLQIMSINRIRLIRLHENKNTAKPNDKKDSLNVDSSGKRSMSNQNGWPAAMPLNTAQPMPQRINGPINSGAPKTK